MGVRGGYYFSFKRVAGPWRRLGVVVLVFSICIAIPVGDEVLGRGVLRVLCATKSDIKVYKQVDLPSQYWDEHGVPISKWIQIDAEHYLQTIGDCCYVENINDKYLSFLRIEKSLTRIKDRKTHEVLSEVAYFAFWRGWIIRNIGLFHLNAVSCRDYRDYRDSIYSPAFRRVN